MSRDKHDIVDSINATDGTEINWRMMDKVIEHVDNLDFLVVRHEAGTYGEGTVVAMMHTLNWTNSINQNKHLVILNIQFSTTYSLLLSYIVTSCHYNIDIKYCSYS